MITDAEIVDFYIISYFNQQQLTDYLVIPINDENDDKCG